LELAKISRLVQVRGISENANIFRNRILALSASADVQTPVELLIKLLLLGVECRQPLLKRSRATQQYERNASVNSRAGATPLPAASACLQVSSQFLIRGDRLRAKAEDNAGKVARNFPARLD
jgi:hypothetical protein